MVWYEHTLPEAPLDAEIVLHVRSVVRRRVRAGTASVEDVALYFGMSSDEQQAVHGTKEAPSLEGTGDRLGKLRGRSVLDLPSDAAYTQTCVAWLSDRKKRDDTFREIVATDPGTLLALSRARELAVAKAPAHIGAPSTAIPILLHGETGTGKELIATAIHRLWANGNTRVPFVPVQVAGMTPALINDELFGHVKGAFTDASSERAGRLEEADGGTLLIDEVGDLPLEAQLRLLRFLQDQAFSRIGSNKSRQLNVRLLSATWHDLDEDVAAGTFRRDLLPRLRVEQIRLPPLRERIGFFDGGLDELVRGLGHASVPLVTRAARDAIRVHPWPGNLRELTSVVRSAIASADGATVRLEDLPDRVQRHYIAQPLHVRAAGALEDLADAGAAPSEVLSARVDALSAIVENHPLPPESPALAALREFLIGIPDPSTDHQGSLSAVSEQIERARRADHARISEAFWRLVLESVSDDAVKRLVEKRLQSSTRTASALMRDVEKTAAKLRLDRSPWMRLVMELQSLPVFAELAPPDLFKLVVFLLRAGYSIAPGVVDEVRTIAKNGGLPALRAKIKDLANSNESVSREERPRGKPSSWTKLDWEQLMPRFSSKAEAARELEIDVRTIDRNLQRFGLTWH